MYKYRFKLCGLDCANCAKKIEENLSKNKEYNSVNVSFATSKLIVETSLKENEVKKKLEKEIQKIEPEVSLEENKQINIMMLRIIISSILLIIGLISKVFYFYFISYLIIGYNIVFKSVRNILKGELFDEFFLMTIATIGAFYIGEYPEAVVVMLFFQIGEYVQEKAVCKSRASVTSLLDLKSDYANLIVNYVTTKVDPTVVKVGDELLVKPGEKIPLDGIIIDGKTTVDTSMLTGEAIPKNVTLNDEVLSGYINLSGLIKLKVTKTSSETVASNILDMIENASEKKTDTERFITKFAKVYTPIVVLCSVLICLLPILLFNGSFNKWFYRSLVFLVVSCPCALVISIPLGFFSGIGTASKNGILVKGSDALELLSEIKIAVFDKTGTITEGKFAVSSVVANNNKNKDLVLKYAALVESFSNHPIAKSILECYGKKINQNDLTDYVEYSGKGITAKYKNKRLVVGNLKLMEQENIQVPLTNVSGTVVYVALNREYLGYLIVEDKIKNRLNKTIKELKKQGIEKCIVVSGDSKEIVSDVCKKIGIKEYYAETLPDKKADIVKTLMKENKVLFIGDGMNDALVLTVADLGISMGGIGSDVANIASDIVIMNDDINKIVKGIKISKYTKQIIWTNIVFALAVKIIVLILGIFGLTSIWLAVFADVGVTLLTILNTLRIGKRY